MLAEAGSLLPVEGQIRKRFDTQCSIFQVHVTGIILISAFTFSPTLVFIQHIKVTLDLNIYDTKIFPQLNKRVVLPYLVMVYRIKTFFRLVQTPPVMGSLELSPSFCQRADVCC